MRLVFFTTTSSRFLLEHKVCRQQTEKQIEGHEYNGSFKNYVNGRLGEGRGSEPNDFEGGAREEEEFKMMYGPLPSD